MADMDTIARALQGFSAGVAGRGQQFLQQLGEDRKQALVEDAYRVENLLREGDVSGAQSLLMDRRDKITQLGGDPSDTVALMNRINQGDLGGALQDAVRVTTAARTAGYLPQLNTKVVNGRLVTVDPITNSIVDNVEIEGALDRPMTEFQKAQIEQGQERLGLEQQRIDQAGRAETGRSRDRALRERQIAVSESAEQRQATKLSAGLEKALLTAQDRVVEAQRSSNEFDVLANDFQRLNLEGGLASTVSETLKGILGTQDDVTEFRRRFNKVRLSEGLKNLPPGPATDRDVQEAFKGVPKENASAEQVASFLRGAARLARFEAGFNQFKADFISNKSTGKGLNQAWRKRFTVTVPGSGETKEVSMAEIYEAAQNRQITPEEVMSKLGIDEVRF